MEATEIPGSPGNRVSSRDSHVSTSSSLGFPKGAFGSGSPDDKTTPLEQQRSFSYAPANNAKRPQQHVRASYSGILPEVPDNNGQKHDQPSSDNTYISKSNPSLKYNCMGTDRPLVSPDGSPRNVTVHSSGEATVTIPIKEYRLLLEVLARVSELEQENDEAHAQKADVPREDESKPCPGTTIQSVGESARELLNGPIGRAVTLENIKKPQSPTKSRPRTGTFPSATGKPVSKFDGYMKPEFDKIVEGTAQDSIVETSLLPSTSYSSNIMPTSPAAVAPSPMPMLPKPFLPKRQKRRSPLNFTPATQSSVSKELHVCNFH